MVSLIDVKRVHIYSSKTALKTPNLNPKLTPIRAIISGFKARFAPPRAKIDRELAIAAKLDRLFEPLENDITQANAASLHRAFRKMRKTTGHKHCNHQNGCAHFQRFTRLVRNRAHYIASRGWYLERLNDGVEELHELKKFLPEGEHALIDNEIRVLEHTREVILGGRREVRRMHGK